MNIKIILAVVIASLFACGNCNAFWIWNPKDQKIVNPKYAVKDSPEVQYDWAMSFYNEGNYIRAAEEFSRLVDYYKNSKLAPDAQYYAALSYQKAGKYYIAFQNYEKVIKQYPYSERIEEIIKSEYELGEIFFNRSRAVLMGVELMADVEKAIEIFSSIIQNMPYSPYADDAQYMIGLSHKKIQQYNEAVEAFQKMTYEYPTSDLADQARYEIAQCMYLASNRSDYAQDVTDDAIKEFTKYYKRSDDPKLREEAEDTLLRLKEKKAGNIFNSAQFYERSKKYRSAAIYYREIISEYPETSFASLARERLEVMAPLLEVTKNE